MLRTSLYMASPQIERLPTKMSPYRLLAGSQVQMIVTAWFQVMGPSSIEGTTDISMPRDSPVVVNGTDNTIMIYSDHDQIKLNFWYLQCWYVVYTDYATCNSDENDIMRARLSET